MTCPLTLIPPPYTDWAARAPLAVNSSPCVLYVWGWGYQLVTPGEGGWVARQIFARNGFGLMSFCFMSQSA